LDEYAEANTKLEKSAIVTSVLTYIRQKSPKGGFIKMDKESGRWHEVSMFENITNTLAGQRETAGCWQFYFEDICNDVGMSTNVSDILPIS
jgi:hypothetical protein